MDKFRPKYIDCACKGEILRLELIDWAREDWSKDYPGVYLSFWENTHIDSWKQPFWHRVKMAWKEFKGKLTHDDFIIDEREKLVELRNTLSVLISEWDVLEKKIKDGKDTSSSVN
jgi:hypothetical protein